MNWLDKTLYPFSPGRFATPEGEMSYVDEGRGPPVLLVHGTPSWSFEFRGVIAELAGKRRVIAPDHLGFGLSDKPATGLDVPDHARRLRALVESLDLRELTLVVHDFGGPIALPLALETDRVRRVVVINSWMWPSEGDPRVARIDRLVRSPVGRFLYRRLGFSARVLLPSAFGDKRRLTRQVKRHYQAPLATRADREGTYAFALALRSADPHVAKLWARRDELRSRLSIVWGDRDPLITSVHRDRWVSAFPEADLTRVPDAGHFVAEERPEVVAAQVLAVG
jgi:haloalkane dehalogenase